MTTGMYWTDYAQAKDRVEGSFVMLNDDPVYIRAVGSAKVPLVAYDNLRTGARESSTSIADFGDFRRLPPLGWVNLINTGRPMAAYLRREPIRGRKHGLSPDSVSIRIFSRDTLIITRDHHINDIFRDPGYCQGLDGDYPSFDDVYEKTPQGTGVAVSRKLLIYHDDNGMRWLYRHRERVGFVSKGKIQVFASKAYHLEDLREGSTLHAVTVE